MQRRFLFGSIRYGERESRLKKNKLEYIFLKKKSEKKEKKKRETLFYSIYIFFKVDYFLINFKFLIFFK